MSKKRDFLSLYDWSRETFLSVLDLASEVKAEVKRGVFRDPLRHKVMGMVFQKPSLRTRVSFEVGMHQLGGHAIYLSPAEVGIGERESVEDVARVLSRYCDVIMARTFAHSIVSGLAKAAPVPVINGLSDYNHPAQIVCDLLTIKEHLGSAEGFKLTWIGDGNNVAVSWLNAAAKLHFDLTLVVPEGFDADRETLERARRDAKGKIEVVRRPEDGAPGTDVFYTDVWTSMGQEAEKAARLKAFAGYCIDGKLVRLGKPGARVMHCLPAHRGEEITHEVMESPQSIVFDQAENRMHGQKAIILWAMGAA
ncbi:MAG: ornithine carbamoyltransferase [Acidobacteriota bacterium]